MHAYMHASTGLPLGISQGSLAALTGSVTGLAHSQTGLSNTGAGAAGAAAGIGPTFSSLLGGPLSVVRALLGPVTSMVFAVIRSFVIWC